MTSRRKFILSSAAFLSCRNRIRAVSPVMVGAGQTTLPAISNDSSIENLTRSFLDHNGISACQLAVCRNSRLILTHSYAPQPPSGYLPIDTNSLFRIASCSKIFTCAAISALHSRGDLDLDLKVFPFLGISTPAMHRDKPDPRIDAITVQHLVNHAGGWNDHQAVVAKDGTRVPGTERDPMFATREIALDLKLDRPPSKLELARYMYGKKLQFAPGSQDFESTLTKSYSNFGYLLLGLVIEKVTGQAYIDFVRTGLGPETDVTNVYLSRLLDGAKNPREVWYFCRESELTALKPLSDRLVSSAYGGGFIPELHDSAGGLMTNAATLASFISRHAVWGLGGRSPGFSRSGSLPGTTSMTYSRPNGVDAAFVLNTREFSGGAQKLEAYKSALLPLLDRL